MRPVVLLVATAAALQSAHRTCRRAQTRRHNNFFDDLVGSDDPARNAAKDDQWRIQQDVRQNEEAADEAVVDANRQKAATAFFDTEGRLMRTAGPVGGEVDRFVPVYKGVCLTRPAPEEDARLAPVLLDAATAAPFLAQDGSIQAWLGTATEGRLAQYGDADQPPGFWLLDVSHLPTPPLLDGGWTPLRASGGPGGGADAILDNDIGFASGDEVALLSVARGLGLWHRSVPYCAVSGEKTTPVRNGRNAQAGKGTRHRPRTDPSVIMLVLDRARERCLLGRQGRWPSGRYSTLAGFVEFGESLEECVCREVLEESGVCAAGVPPSSPASRRWRVWCRSDRRGRPLDAALRRGDGVFGAARTPGDGVGVATHHSPNFRAAGAIGRRSASSRRRRGASRARSWSASRLR